MFKNFLSSITGQNWRYELIQQAEVEEVGSFPLKQVRARRKIFVNYIFALLCFLLCLAILVLAIGYNVNWRTGSTHGCRHPVSRREWRTLTEAEQSQYIGAVQCLMQKASVIKTESTRYDDFAYVHTVEGVVTHYAAGFLPWHRYYLHAYELALQQECGYEGTLAYWDWTADAADFAASPIWDNEFGFGGDGDSLDEESIFHGRCVMEGPFANSTRYWQSKSNGHGFDLLENPHCLSRGFSKGDDKQRLQLRISEAIIADILGQPTYSDFVDALETRSHNAIPLFVKGDFFGMTAPNDPVFYLHHSQVDRLWWLWQQKNSGARWDEYGGPSQNVKVHARHDENVTRLDASVEDMLSLGILAKDLRVKEVMTTQSDLLCYMYQ